MHAQAYFQPLLTAHSRLVSLLSAPPVKPAQYRRSFAPFAPAPVEEPEAYPEILRVSQTVVVTLTKGSRVAVYAAYFEDPYGPARIEVQGDANHFRRANGQPVSLDRYTLDLLAPEAVHQASESRAEVSICSLPGQHLWK